MEEITFNGITKTVKEWAEDVGITRQAMLKRLKNMPIEEALTKRKGCGKGYTYNGETHTLYEWSQIVGISDSTLHDRLADGMSIAQALTKPIRTYEQDVAEVKKPDIPHDPTRATWGRNYAEKQKAETLKMIGGIK